jgi:zinc protease
MADSDLGQLKPYILKYIGGLPVGNDLPSYVYRGGRVSTSADSLERKVGDSPKATVSLVYQRQDIPGSLEMFNLENQLLCEVVKVRLLNELREKMGMIYSVGVTSGATLYPTPLSRNTISFKCLPENAGLLIATIQGIFEQMQKSPEIFETALNDVKTNLVKTMKAEKQKDSYWIGQIRNKIYNGEKDWSFQVDYDQIVQSITKEQVAALIPICFDKNRLIKGILLPKRVAGQ